MRKSVNYGVYFIFQDIGGRGSFFFFFIYLNFEFELIFTLLMVDHVAWTG